MSDDKSPAEIEREIEAERGALARSLEDLQDQLSPERMMDTASVYVRDHGGEIAENVGRQIKDNPVAAALTGIGLVWLIAGSGRKASPPTYDRWSSTHDESVARRTVAPVASTPEPVSRPVRPAYDDRPQPQVAGLRRTGDPMHGSFDGYDERLARASGDYSEDPSAWDRVSDGASALSDRLAKGWAELKYSFSSEEEAEIGRREWMAGAREGFTSARTRETRIPAPSSASYGGHKSDRTYSKAADLKARFSQGTENMTDAARTRVLRARQAAYAAQLRMEERMGDYADEGREYYNSQPLVGGLLAFGIGALIGASLPRTARENDTFGAYRDRAFDEAERVFRQESDKLRAVAGAAVDEAKNVVGDAVDTAKGVTPTGSEAVNRAEGVVTSAADRVKRAAEEEAQKQKLGSSLN